jgi:hypothetical protein
MIITHGVGVSAAFSKYTKVFGSAIDSDRPKKVVIHEISRKRFFLSAVFFSKTKHHEQLSSFFSAFVARNSQFGVRRRKVRYG